MNQIRLGYGNNQEKQKLRKQDKTRNLHEKNL